MYLDGKDRNNTIGFHENSPLGFKNYTRLTVLQVIITYVQGMQKRQNHLVVIVQVIQTRDTNMLVYILKHEK